MGPRCPSVNYDLHEKLDVYLEHGAREYLAVLVEDREVRWHIRRSGRFATMRARDGLLRSRTFPGLWLDPAALLAGDGARLLETLRLGLDTDEHAAFAARLVDRRR